MACELDRMEKIFGKKEISKVLNKIHNETPEQKDMLAKSGKYHVGHSEGAECGDKCFSK